MNWLDFFAGSVGSLATTGIFMFLFKEAIKSMLKKTVEADLARVTHELDVKKEIIKNELNRDAYKAQLMLNNVHAIYPELAAKLEHAFGAVSGLQGFSFAINFEQYQADDIKTYLASHRLPKGKHDELIVAIDRDRTTGIKSLKDTLREVEISEARHCCAEAQNYRVIKAIYCSDQVLQTFDDCYKIVWSAWVDLDVGRIDPSLWQKGSNTIRKEAPDKMDAFRKAVRAELRID